MMTQLIKLYFRGKENTSDAAVKRAYASLSGIADIFLMTLLGFQIARFGRGSTHPFGHGRFEWIMGIFASLAVVLMGEKLIHTSLQSIVSPQKPLFSVAAVVVPALSIFIKGYMYFYNRQFAKITNSETLKATAALRYRDLL